MKMSISIPDDDVRFIDRYAEEHDVDSRSGVVHRALSLLRANELGEDYAAAWQEWESSADTGWDATVADGVSAS